MAGHLLKHGHKLHIHNRTKAKAQPLLDAGAIWHDTPGSAASQADVVITMLGFPKDVETSYLGSDGVVERAAKGTLLIDMTTSSPSLARRVFSEAAKKGMSSLDAPVSGGDLGAREAKLAIMVGGSQEAFNRALPLFNLMGKNIALHGPAGAGQICKMANQIAVAGNIVAWVESLTYAQKAGLDPATVLATISSGAAGSWSMANLGPRSLKGDFEPGFYVKHFLKDMKIALESAEELNLQLPGFTVAKKLYDEIATKGWENKGTQVLWKLYSSRL
jgi:3-hydroxyisobutyrate dehydrogenase